MTPEFRDGHPGLHRVVVGLGDLAGKEGASGGRDDLRSVAHPLVFLVAVECLGSEVEAGIARCSGGRGTR